MAVTLLDYLRQTYSDDDIARAAVGWVNWLPAPADLVSAALSENTDASTCWEMIARWLRAETEVDPNMVESVVKNYLRLVDAGVESTLPVLIDGIPINTPDLFAYRVLQLKSNLTSETYSLLSWRLSDRATWTFLFKPDVPIEVLLTMPIGHFGVAEASLFVNHPNATITSAWRVVDYAPVGVPALLAKYPDRVPDLLAHPDADVRIHAVRASTDIAQIRPLLNDPVIRVQTEAKARTAILKKDTV